MALYVTDDKGTKEWHIPFSGIKHFYNFGNKVTNAQADGDELEYIKNNFGNIPMALNKRVVEWFDSDAKFIVRHLV